MRVDELVLDELNRQVDDHAEQRVLGRGEQREERADDARGERAHVWHKGEQGRQEADEPA